MKDKIELTPDQIKILELLNIKLYHDFWPHIIDATKDGMIKFDRDSEDFKFGYAKAVWDITLVTSAAVEGYLPSTKELKAIASDPTLEFKMYNHSMVDKFKWKKYKYNKKERQT